MWFSKKKEEKRNYPDNIDGDMRSVEFCDGKFGIQEYCEFMDGWHLLDDRYASLTASTKGIASKTIKRIID